MPRRAPRIGRSSRSSVGAAWVALVIWSPSYRLAWFRQTVVVAASEDIGAVPRRRGGSAL
jgi:hypothetical protein